MARDAKESIADRAFPAAPITTFEGWRSYASRPIPVRPRVPSPEEWARMSPEAKRISRKERRIWHSEFPPLKISAQRKIIRAGIDLAIFNYRTPPGARTGFAVDGLGTLGKSTTMMELGRQYEATVRRSLGLGPFDNINENIFIPVVYVTLSSEMTIKAFNELLVGYYGIPTSKRMTTGQMTSTIARVAKGCGTTLIIVDDVHFLKMTNESGQQVNNHIKTLAAMIPATIGCAGVNLEGSGFFSEGESEERRPFSQTDHRFIRHPLLSFKKGSEKLREILREFEKSLCLVNQEAGDLVGLADYIHDRTNGFTGAISNLLRQGANLAIRNGEERLSLKLLDKIKLDRASERHWLAARGRGPS
jgi:hypothetical protein